MKGNNSYLSSLFNNLTSGSLFGSVNFTDYASLKNGSYKKLVKAYYAEQNESVKNESKASEKTNSVKSKNSQSIDKSAMSQVKNDADDLKAAVNKLASEDLWKKTNDSYDEEKIKDAVKTFVDDYNNTLSQSSKVNSKEVSMDVQFMSSLSGTMSKTLSKAGISVGIDGKLSVSDDSLKKADISSIKSLFTGKVSYGSQIADKAEQISKDAVMNSSIYKNNGTSVSSISLFDNYI